jgi:catechol 2,3-dioxygenase-like lactoylglutathione lyase family enzyme
MQAQIGSYVRYHAAQRETCGVPSITGRVDVNLTVRDPLVSAAWYGQLLRMEQLYEFVPADGRVSYVCLVEPGSGLVLCFVGHPTNRGEPFDETHTGLDHLEFIVATRDELDEWASRLDQLGVEHSGVKQPAHTENAMLTFRDTDNIQLEFFWRSPSTRHE